jgi:flavin reductase (DIM6/NTAB) family NADH-FMN oxidoreductase RutF
MASELDRKAFRDLSYGLYLVTSFKGDRLNGQVVNTVIQVTSEPPRVAVIINKKNLTHDFILKSQVFAVSVLEESAPMASSGLSASSQAVTWTSSPRWPSRRAARAALSSRSTLFLSWRRRSSIGLTLGRTAFLSPT